MGKPYRKETKFVSILIVHVPDVMALVDMLRYDRCCPYDQDESAKLYRLLGEHRGSRGHSKPSDHVLRLIRYGASSDGASVGRWASYECRVLDERSPDAVQLTDEEALRLAEVTIAKEKRAK